MLWSVYVRKVFCMWLRSGYATIVRYVDGEDGEAVFVPRGLAGLACTEGRKEKKRMLRLYNIRTAREALSLVTLGHFTLGGLRGFYDILSCMLL